MGKAFYRTYRSKKLSEIVGQEHITTALQHALENGKISHAYLFTGPRGVGKTSIARILAHEINDLPYSDDSQHLDIIEIDAASNRRIDEIRDLRDKVNIAPSSAKFKVYIIDEVHMLTKEAFNALLKTLEEPPAHVVFILATTEAHKLPETIISRTQRYTFKPVDSQKVVAHLRQIADTEKINISDDALGLIAAHGEGSFRDSIGLLDQVQNSGAKVSLSDVQEVLGLAPTELFDGLIVALSTHDSLAVAKVLVSIRQQGYAAGQIATQLGGRLRSDVVSGLCKIAHATVIKLLENLIMVPASLDPYVALEIALLDAALADTQIVLATPKVTAQSSASTVTAQVSTTPAKAARAVVAVAAKQNKAPNQEQEAALPTPQVEAEALAKLPNIDGDLLLDDASWALVMGALRKNHATLHSLINGATANFSPGKVMLTFEKDFSRKQVGSVKNKEIIGKVIEGVVGSQLQIECDKVSNGDSFSTVSNIFGGAELLES